MMMLLMMMVMMMMRVLMLLIIMMLMMMMMCMNIMIMISLRKDEDIGARSNNLKTVALLSVARKNSKARRFGAFNHRQVMHSYASAARPCSACKQTTNN